MKCLTATMDATNEIGMDLFIKRPVRRSGHGLRAWLGHPFDVRAEVGPQNEGRPCDFIEVADQFLDRGSEEVHITRCSVDTNGLADRVRLLPETAGDDGYLVLLRIVHSVTPAEPDRVIEFVPSQHHLAEGYVVDYGTFSNSRRPVRFLNSRVEERLIQLRIGETYRFYQSEPEARVLGMAVHYGRWTTYEIEATPTGLPISRVAATPLTLPVFDASALADDVAVALMCLVVGIICGIIVAPAAGGFCPSCWSALASR